jgi:hypothetical protein
MAKRLEYTRVGFQSDTCPPREFVPVKCANEPSSLAPE